MVVETGLTQPKGAAGDIQFCVWLAKSATTAFTLKTNQYFLFQTTQSKSGCSRYRLLYPQLNVTTNFFRTPESSPYAQLSKTKKLETIVTTSYSAPNQLLVCILF